MRLLKWPWHGMHALEVPESALMRHAFLGPQPLDRGDAFVEHRSAVLHVEPIRRILLRNESPAKAHVEAAMGDVVQHSELARQLDRMVEGRDHPAGDRAHAPGAAPYAPPGT